MVQRSINQLLIDWLIDWLMACILNNNIRMTVVILLKATISGVFFKSSWPSGRIKQVTSWDEERVGGWWAGKVARDRTRVRASVCVRSHLTTVLCWQFPRSGSDRKNPAQGLAFLPQYPTKSLTNVVSFKTYLDPSCQMHYPYWCRRPGT